MERSSTPTHRPPGVSWLARARQETLRAQTASAVANLEIGRSDQVWFIDRMTDKPVGRIIRELDRHLDLQNDRDDIDKVILDLSGVYIMSSCEVMVPMAKRLALGLGLNLIGASTKPVDPTLMISAVEYLECRTAQRPSIAGFVRQYRDEQMQEAAA